MRVRTCFISLNYLLAFLAVSCLLLGEVIPLSFGILVLTMLGTFWILEWNKKIPVMPHRLFSLWKIGLIALPAIYVLFQPKMLDLVTGFLLFVLLSRFLFKTELNDYLYGYLVSIVCLLIGAIFTQDLVFAFMFLAFYLILSWALMFYHMMVEKVGSRAAPQAFRFIGEADTARGSLFGLSSLMILVSLVITATIFFSFPRFGLGFLELATSSSPVTGFSDQVRLGEVGEIKKNQSVVMRVEFTRDGKPYRPKSKVLWRGVALDHYDGQTWRSTMPMVWRSRHRPGTNTVLFHVPNPTTVVEQEVYMESFDSPVIFTHGVPMKIDGTFERIQMDNGQVFKTTDNRMGPRRFSMISDLGADYHAFRLPIQPDLSFLQKGTHPHLQLPQLSDRLKQFAPTLVNDSDPAELKASKIMNHLQYFDYSMDMKRETRLSAIDEFLFVRKTGHCEYFASAMVLLLRINGIPARMVNGFMGTEWNEMGNYMIVRQANAHSWVEAYIPGKGWKTYDPTPPDPNAGFNQLNALTRTYDMMRLYWQRYIVKYSAKDQVRVVEFFNRRAHDFTAQIKKIRSLTFDDLLKALGNRPEIWVGIAVVTALLLLFPRTRFWKGWFWIPTPPYAAQLYQKMLRKLEKRGIHKPASSTHLEFMEHLSGLPEEKLDCVRKITGFYEQHRFGKGFASKHQIEHMEKLVRQL
ncbi:MULTISPECIES: transglutaminase TgpA family protein [unclassified Nitrospina]|uniref:transglutaminase TgpA family protein n=1 Tax=unclassified Nitrospina TaxID=2638683 RepID=UPI003F9AECB4